MKVWKKVCLGLVAALLLAPMWSTTPVHAATPVTAGMVTQKFVGQVTYVPGYGINLSSFNAQGKPTYLRKLANASKWQIKGYKNFSGKKYYNLGGNQWAEARYIAPATPAINWMKPSENKPYPKLQAGDYFSVSIANQRVYVRNKKNQTLYTMYASTGANNGTPRGTFHIQAERGYSFYNYASGEGAHYWTSFLNHGEYLFHSVPVDIHGQYIPSEAKKLGTPVSHGCVRLPVPDAQWIMNNARTGMVVVIA
ncbi:L,D-transpeptidase [Lacticaseibacillus saniviri]